MADVSFSISIDDGLKREFEAVCNANDLTINEAFALFAEETVQMQEFPFSLDEDLIATLELSSSTTVKNTIIDGLNTPSTECITENLVEW